MDKLETLLACLPPSDFKNIFTAEIEQLRQRVQELENECESFREAWNRGDWPATFVNEQIATLTYEKWGEDQARIDKLTAERDAAIKLQDEANALLIEQARANESLKQQRDELRQRVAELEAVVKKSNDRLNEERDIWDRMFGDGEKKLERIEIELDDCLHVLEALWMKQNTPELTDLWAKILIRNKRDTGASSAEDTCHPTTE